MKLKAQFALVLSAFAGARILSGTISAGYNHVMPNQPIAKKVLKRKRKRAATMPEVLVPSLVMIVKIICLVPSPGLDQCQRLCIYYIYMGRRGSGDYLEKKEGGGGGGWGEDHGE